MVSINWTIFWEVVNLLVLIWLLKRYLYRPIKGILDQRSQKIEGDLNQAEGARKEAEGLKESYQNQLKEARKKAQEILENAELRAKKQAKEIVATARQEAEKIKESKLQELEQAKKEALGQLRNEVASISVLIAGRLIQEKLDYSKHEALINQYLKELDQKRLGELK